MSSVTSSARQRDDMETRPLVEAGELHLLDMRASGAYFFCRRQMWLLRLRRFDRDVGLVLASFIVLIAIENLAVGLGYRAEFVGTWEMGSARLYLSPIALAFLFPVAAAVVLMSRVARPRYAWAIAIIAAFAGAGLGVGVSMGRRLSNLAIRIPFVVLLTLVVAGAAWILVKYLGALRLRFHSIAAIGAIVAIVAWLADAFVLRRLYPAFHLALLFVLLFGWSATSLLFRRLPRAAADGIALFSIVILAVSIAWSPQAAMKVRVHDNLRRVLLERAPVLGRSVIIASRIAPPLPMPEVDEAATSTLASLRDRKGKPRALDWRGHDIILVTIDALRADHVSSYGYPRKTTPNIDALAAQGVRFEHAYCPTPHTSYSVASMMTGKYMKPLLSLSTLSGSSGGKDAIEDDSETWAVQLRRYGFRTAAFYPPAIFFIDEHRFTRMRDDHLGFEYSKEEFAGPDLRRAQIDRYLSSAPKDKPIFLWVHLFEPHEPYEMHAAHPFNDDPKVDAYDSEIAAADDLVGDVTKLVAEKRPPGAVFIVSADHGEELGDHGGRYHGTTVYEEQVRVPLIVVAPGVTPRVSSPPVQTIDLLPTSLAALDVPIPPRLRGRDLGPAIVGTEAKTEEGLAFAETDDYTLVARGSDRLVCARKIASCTLFDVARDPAQKQPVADRPERVMELRKLTAAIERETGKVEASELPEALRRGLQGDRDAAEDVAPLLDDSRVDIRRAAARCAFKLKAPEMTAQLRRALQHDEDAEVRNWCALALVRLGDPLGVGDKAGAGGGAGSLVESMVKPPKNPASLDPSFGVDERTAAALALAERGDARGESFLVVRWSAAFRPDAHAASPRVPGEIDEARELLAAFAKIKSRAAVPVLAKSLDDVRLRPHVVEALAETNDPRAKAALLQAFTDERYVHLRSIEARALVKLGARFELFPPLVRFAGTPEPMIDAINIAHDARLLTPDKGAKEWATPPAVIAARVRFGKAGLARILVWGDPATTPPGSELIGEINGVPVAEMAPYSGTLFVAEVGELRAGDVQLKFTSPTTIRAVWLVPRAAEIPPPPPRPWTPAREPDPDPPDGGPL